MGAASLKKKLAFSAMLAALVAALAWPGQADQRHTVPAAGADIMPASEILANVRAMGLNPLGRMARRGDYYVLHALDPYGVELRVVADAQFGDIVTVAPARALVNAYAPRYDSGPRIIHVPQKGDNDRAAVRGDVPADDDAAAATADDDVVAPPKRRSDAPPPGPRRAVLSAPPPAAGGPSPVKPTPRWRESDKFTPPGDGQVTTSVPALPPLPALPPAAESAPLPSRD